jgi:hypothetical protein
MPLGRSTAPSLITLRYEYVLPIVNQKSIWSAGIGTSNESQNDILRCSGGNVGDEAPE